MRNIEGLRSAAVAEAYSWLNTPYLDCANIKGPKGGVDCAMLLISIYQTVGLVPLDYDPRPYSPDWHLHQDAELYMFGLQRYAHEVERALPGDIAMFKFGRHASHGALVVSDNFVIHAHKKARCVELMEIRAFQERLHSYWSPY